MRGVRSTHERRRRGLTVAVLALTASVLIPAALALACNPQAYLTIDRSSYAPGESVRVAGSFFRGDTDITVSVDRTGQSQTVKTTANGAFSTTFAMPQNAPTGGYSVQAIGYEANGSDVIPGLPARGSFSVAAAAEATPEPSDEGRAQPAREPAAQAAAPAAQSSPPAAVPQASRPAQRQTFREPPVFSEPDVQQSRAERGSTGSTATESRAQSDTATSNGRQVFAGSLAPAPSFTTVVPAPRVVVTGPAANTQAARPRGSAESRNPGNRSQPSPAVSRQTSEQTASDDLWSALSPGQSPSVLPVAGDGMAVESTSAGSGLAIGLLLASGAVLALLGGLAVADARRRRIRVR